MKIDPDAPAFPARIYDEAGRQLLRTPGMTVRAELASRAMQGMLSNAHVIADLDVVANHAVKAADALIERLNQE